MDHKLLFIFLYLSLKWNIIPIVNVTLVVFSVTMELTCLAEWQIYYFNMYSQYS